MNTTKLMYTSWLGIILLGFTASLSAQPPQRKAVFIIVDGIPSDVIEKVPTPHLDRIAQAGKYLKAYVGGAAGTYSQTPTISAVGYNSLLTGTWANKHNVWDNAIKAPNYHYPTIFRLLKNQYPDKKTAIFSSWTDNRTKLVGEGLSQTGNIHLDYHADGYELDTLTFPHDAQRDFMHQIDETVTNAAATCLQEKGPDLSWVYLEYTDDMGHKFGDSQPFYQAVEKMDAQVGRISQALQHRQKNHAEEWLLIITTDHGRDAQTGKGHGGQSERERGTWIVTNYPSLNAYATQTQPGIVDIMPTLARYLNITIPHDINREIDGVPLIGKVSLAQPTVAMKNDSLFIQWKALEPAGAVKVWVATTNQFQNGGKDEYQLLTELPLKQEQASVKIDKQRSSFYKVVLEAPNNTINQWVTHGIK
jgi:arylsulfatase A-like enzyme